MNEMEVIMNQIFSYILVAIMALLGGGTSLALVIMLPAVIIWKIYRRVRYGIKITN